jgi:hypothetical protein
MTLLTCCQALARLLFNRPFAGQKGMSTMNPFAGVVQERNELFLRRVGTVFQELIRWYPRCVLGYLELYGELIQESETMFGEVWSKPRTKTQQAEDANQVQKDCQDFCNRMASLLRGLAMQAGVAYPFLAERFHRVAEDAADILEDYKASLGKDGLTDEQRKTELQLSKGE